MTTQNGNGKVEPSRLAIWANWIESTYVQQVVALLVERVLRRINFSFTARGVTWSFSVTPHSTTIAVTYKEPRCQSPDPEPSKAQSTVTATP